MNYAKKIIIRECIEDIESIYPQLLEDAYYYVEMSDSYMCCLEGLLDDSDGYQEYMNPFTTIDLVEEFLLTIDESHLKKFKHALSDGTFNFFNEYTCDDDTIYEPICIELDNNLVDINMPIDASIYDGGFIVHEFFHYTNVQEKEHGIRYILTEFISIYMELRYYQFLIKKGYNKSILYSEINSRLSDTFYCASEVCDGGSIIDIFFHTGDISEESIEFMKKYRPLYNKYYIRDNLADYDNLDIDTVETLVSLFYANVSYLIGTSLALPLLNEPEINDAKIIYLNENLENLELDQVFSMFNTHKNSYNDWISECKKMLVGDEFESSNSNSRSNRNR